MRTHSFTSAAARASLAHASTQHGARYPGDKQREIRVPAWDVPSQRRGPLGSPPITGNSRPDERTRGSIQLPRLMLGRRHNATLSEASSSH